MRNPDFTNELALLAQNLTANGLQAVTHKKTALLHAGSKAVFLSVSLGDYHSPFENFAAAVAIRPKSAKPIPTRR